MLMNFKVRVGRVVNFFKLSIVPLICFVAVLFSNFGIATAAPNVPGASGLSISPLHNEITLLPGKASVINLTLKNITGGPILAKASILDFTSDGSTGNPKIITNPNYNDPASIKNFIIGLGDVRLSIGEQTVINIPVQVPKNTPPGAYFGLIEYQSIPQKSSSQAIGVNKVALSAGVTSLVFITVPGNVTDRMELNSINIYSDNQGNNAGVFFTQPPKMAGISLSNIANAFEKPFGTILLQNMSGKQVYSYQLNSAITRGIVLPYSSRIFKNKLQNINTPGRYTIVANVSYGRGSAILIGKKSFWYIPLWLWLIIAAVVLVLVGSISVAIYKYRTSINSKFKHS